MPCFMPGYENPAETLIDRQEAKRQKAKGKRQKANRQKATFKLYFSLISLRSIFSKFFLAGAVSISPSASNLDPWHGQSHDCSALFQATLHLMCVQAEFTACTFPFSSLNKAIEWLSYFTTCLLPGARSASSLIFEDGNHLPIRFSTTSAASFTIPVKPAIDFILFGLYNFSYSLLPNTTWSVRI